MRPNKGHNCSLLPPSLNIHGAINALLVGPLFLSTFPSATAQAKSTPDGADAELRRDNSPILTILMFGFLVIFIVIGFYSVLLRRCSSGNDGAQNPAAETEPRRTRARRGLQPEVIASFPMFLYSEVKGLKIGNDTLECAICLNEFEDHETLRLIPQCSHVFHPGCIDVWLQDHNTCPVCRANLALKPDETGSFQIPDLNTSPVVDPVNITAEGTILESHRLDLINSAMSPNRNAPRRSKSMEFSEWHATPPVPTRSRSTGQTLVLPVENLERFTLRLPDVVRNQLVKSSLERAKSDMAILEDRIPIRGYRSGSVGREKSEFTYDSLDGREENRPNRYRRAFSLSSRVSAPTGLASALVTHGNDQVTASLSEAFFKSIKSPLDQFFRGKDGIGEGSSDRLRPADQV